MSRLFALTRRELEAHFFAPVPYLVMFLFLLMTWMFFVVQTAGAHIRVSFQPVFESLTFVLLILVPLLTMNSVAAERAENTLETLLTAPVRDWQVIAAKWLGTFSFYLTMLVPTLVYWAVLVYLGRHIGKPDTGPVLAAYLGAMLLGGLYIAIGIFASSLTENALLSAFLAFFTLIALLVVAYIPEVSSLLPDSVGESLTYLNQQEHFAVFLTGKIAAYDVIYFVSMTAFFLFLAVRALESRKWR